MPVAFLHGCRKIRLRAMVLLLALLALFLPGVSRAAADSAPPPEIAHLLDYIEASGCAFFRNGAWHTDTKAVRGHVEMKYRYFMGKGKIASTEDFIRWSATRSEISGKTYMVKCGGQEMPLAEWLARELARFRKDNPAR